MNAKEAAQIVAKVKNSKEKEKEAAIAEEKRKIENGIKNASKRAKEWYLSVSEKIEEAAKDEHRACEIRCDDPKNPVAKAELDALLKLLRADGFKYTEIRFEDNSYYDSDYGCHVNLAKHFFEISW